jgi:pimeloyl-ACP methyl ester carboxylesterase
VDPTSSLDAWQKAGKPFTHGGYTLFTQEGGAGPPLVLIHGFPTASWDWAPLWPTLAKRFQLYAMDMLGFGFSSKPRRHPYSIFEQADLYEAYLAARGVEHVHVLAHDYGDTVAQELLARHEERRASGRAGLVLRSICFLNGGLFPEAHRPRPVQKLLASPIGPLLSRLASEKRFGQGFSEIFGPRTKPSAAQLADFWRLVSHDGGARLGHELIAYMQERRTNRERWVTPMLTTRVPLKLVDGPEDPVSGAHLAKRYRELVPNADVVLLDGIGHYPQVEDPQGVLRAFLAFHLERVRDA